MAFQEAGKPTQENSTSGGLIMEWSNLIDEKCPKCEDDLTLFEDILLYKCACGFKISSRRLEEIGSSIENGNENSFGAYSWGFNMGNWDDEPPFGNDIW